MYEVIEFNPKTPEPIVVGEIEELSQSALTEFLEEHSKQDQRFKDFEVVDFEIDAEYPQCANAAVKVSGAIYLLQVEPTTIIK